MDLFNEPMKDTISEKLEFLHTHHIAIWDVFSSCDIKGADDSSIKNALLNDLDPIFDIADIKAVFTNGQKASTAYKRFFSQEYSIQWICLPSTSPANCRNWTYDTLKEAWRVILDYL